MNIMVGWQTSSVHSPANSVDSGVELSPRNTSFYGYDEISPCSQNFGDVNPGSPTSACCPSGNMILPVNAKLQAPPSLTDYYYPEQLTPDELDCLSSSVSDISDCCPDDLADISQFELSLSGEEVDYTCASISNGAPVPSFNEQEPTVNQTTAIRKKRRFKSRISTFENFPNIDPCLIPKSGTAKPRQSRKKPKVNDGGSMSAGTNMKPMKCYSGARVKETAKEKLQRIRNEKRKKEAEGMQSSPHSVIQLHQSGVAQGKVDEGGSEIHRVSSQYEQGTSSIQHGRIGQDMKPMQQSSHRYTPYSVNKILHCTEFQERFDNLDHVINWAFVNDNLDGLGKYIEGEKIVQPVNIIFHGVVNKLNQMKDLGNVKQMKKITEFLCAALPDFINSRNYNGQTPVYLAAHYGNIGMLEVLMAHLADPWIIENCAGETALHAVISNKSVKAVQVILKRGDGVLAEKINTMAYNGNTALHKATDLRDVSLEVQKQIVMDLLDAGADPSLKNNVNQMAHSLLPPSLKELQDHMKKRIGERRRLHRAWGPERTMSITSRPSQCMSATPFPSHYPMYPPSFYNPSLFNHQQSLMYTHNFSQARPYSSPLTAIDAFTAQLSAGTSYTPEVPPRPIVSDVGYPAQLPTLRTTPTQSTSATTSEYSQEIDDLIELTYPNVSTDMQQQQQLWGGHNPENPMN